MLYCCRLPQIYKYRHIFLSYVWSGSLYRSSSVSSRVAGRTLQRSRSRIGSDRPLFLPYVCITTKYITITVILTTAHHPFFCALPHFVPVIINPTCLIWSVSSALSHSRSSSVIGNVTISPAVGCETQQINSNQTRRSTQGSCRVRKKTIIHINTTYTYQTATAVAA